MLNGCSGIPTGCGSLKNSDPALKRRAIFKRPSDALPEVSSWHALGNVAEDFVGRAVGEAGVFEGVYAEAIGAA